MAVVGNTTSLATLMDQLTVKGSENGLDDTDIEWTLFIQDHKTIILEGSYVIFINNSTMTQYEHHLRWFLADNQIDKDLLDIVMLINNFTQESDFANMDKLFIPDKNQLITLRKQYKQYKQMLTSADYS